MCIIFRLDAQHKKKNTTTRTQRLERQKSNETKPNSTHYRRIEELTIKLICLETMKIFGQGELMGAHSPDDFSHVTIKMPPHFSNRIFESIEFQKHFFEQFII